MKRTFLSVTDICRKMFLKHAPHLLDTNVQAECRYRPPALLAPDGRVIFVHVLVQPVHSTHCFVIMFDKEFSLRLILTIFLLIAVDAPRPCLKLY